MTVLSTLATPTGAPRPETVTRAVMPTPTELDRWQSGFESGRIALENLDTAQTVSGWVEVRPIAGVGTFGRAGETSWLTIPALALRDFEIPTWTLGAGEFRFMAQASGAGLSVKYTRRNIHTVNT